MNAYMIKTNKGIFITDGDTIEDAEQKFTQFARQQDDWEEDDWSDYSTESISIEEARLLSEQEQENLVFL